MDPNNEMGVKFDEDQWVQPAPSFTEESPTIIQLVVKWSGGSISERQAEYVLFGFVILAIAVSLFLFFSGSRGPNIPLPSGGKIIYPGNAPPRLEQPF